MLPMAPPALGHGSSLRLTSYVPESCHAKRTMTGPQFFSSKILSIILCAPVRVSAATAVELIWKMEDALVNRAKDDDADGVNAVVRETMLLANNK